MKLQDFTSRAPGTLVQAPAGHTAYLPKPLPPQIDFGTIALKLANAQQKLGELSGLGTLLPNPYLLSRPFIRREALSSSEMEGTVTTSTDLLAFEAGAEQKSMPTFDEAREVHNYARALENAFTSMGQLPICRRMLTTAHTTLLTGIKAKFRGANQRPGEFRETEPAWTDSRNIQDARFVFAPPNAVSDLFSEFERYVQTIGHTSAYPPLVDAALAHYQFETIHPFHDGNGRVGRLLIPLILCKAGQLSQPLLYISPFFARNKDEYVRRMYNVSTQGAWDSWVQFFLEAIEVQASDALDRAKRLLKLHEQYCSRIQQARTPALQITLVDMIFEQPMITIPMAETRLEVNYGTAKSYVERLVAEGILKALENRSRPQVFWAPEVYKIIWD